MTAIHVKSPVLQWSLGPRAQAHIAANGLQVDDIDLLVGASGGPKWLVLEGLDRALFGDFLQARTRPLPCLASSIGSWRFACLGQKQPLNALDRFRDAYLAQSYPEKVTVHDVSRVLDEVLSHLMGSTGAEEILAHRFLRTSVVAIRSKGLLRSENKPLLASGLVATYFANLVKRDGLGVFCERSLFHDARQQAASFDDQIPTAPIELSVQNLELALRASAAVPLVLAGVKDIPGGPAGVYRDGGVVDYHFSGAAAGADDLVLYPHFYPYFAPGWLDKSRARRHLTASSWPNLIMVSPSQAFIDGLPGGKIPDRKDFYNMDNQERIRFWNKVVAESQRLGDAFLQAIEDQRFE
ncbi:MAG: patatin-like phospholipase family protein [Pseudomonadales bacterium]|nr:patatin-like phospholipase family protein [Pseudomonadales bacterium]